MPAIVAQSVAASTAPGQRCWAVSVEAERTVRDASAKAQTVEDAIYDLKAVNPKERKQGDLRTPIQLLEAIEAKGRVVDEVLARLRELTSANSAQRHRRAGMRDGDPDDHQPPDG